MSPSIRQRRVTRSAWSRTTPTTQPHNRITRSTCAELLAHSANELFVPNAAAAEPLVHRSPEQPVQPSAKQPVQPAAELPFQPAAAPLGHHRR